jgi:hypothetical protein
MEMVTGMIPPSQASEDLDMAIDHDADEAGTGRPRRESKAKGAAKPAPRGKQSRGRGA